MKFKDNYDFDLLINEAENVAIEELERQLSLDTENAICKCQECILDIVAFALNKLKPGYRSSFKGVIYAQSLYDGEYKSEVEKAIQEAIDVVKKYPSHELKQ